ncbi:unnamed protein product [Prorocentrum cordatum]|uniref:Uncharacterized protein n=1 Tax=Prorocentrum cordatum TaxID=2364126 RepID=A0ABN9XKH0_9DINO|nr:unnamed protein product [Polarella glacialis]
MLSNTTQDTVATGGSKQSEMQGTKTARQEEIEWRRNTWVNSKMHQGCCNAYLDDHPSGDEEVVIMRLDFALATADTTGHHDTPRDNASHRLTDGRSGGGLSTTQ